MVLLIVLIVAIALVVVWLLFEVAQVTSGGLRLPRIHEGSLQGALGGAPPISRGNGNSAETVATEREVAPEREEPEQAELQDERRQEPRYDAADVEQAVYDRLYGQRGRRA